MENGHGFRSHEAVNRFPGSCGVLPEPRTRPAPAWLRPTPHACWGRAYAAQRGRLRLRRRPAAASGAITVDLDKLPQQGCPACGNLAKTAVLWPKTTPAQVPLAPAKTPLRRPEKATGRAVVAVTTPPRAAEHAATIRTAGCVHCGWQQACAAARWRVYGAGVGTARRASELLALATPPAKKNKQHNFDRPRRARSLDARSAARPPPPAAGEAG